MSWDGRFDEPPTPSPDPPSSSSVGRDTPPSSRNSATPSISPGLISGKKTLKHPASSNNLNLDGMTLTSPDPVGRRLGTSETVSKFRTAGYPLDISAVEGGSRDKNNLVEQLREFLQEIFPDITRRACMQALDLCNDNLHAAANEIVTYPHRFEPSHSYSLSPGTTSKSAQAQDSENSSAGTIRDIVRSSQQVNVPELVEQPQQLVASTSALKDGSSSSGRPANGILPSVRLNLRSIKTEPSSRSLEIGQSNRAFEPSDCQVTTRLVTPIEDSDYENYGEDSDNMESDDEQSDLDENLEESADKSEMPSGFKEKKIIDKSINSVVSKAKLHDLYAIFPDAGLAECRRILQCVDGNLTEAVEMMDELRPGDLAEDTVMRESRESSRSFAGPPKPHNILVKPTKIKIELGDRMKRGSEDIDTRPSKRTRPFDGGEIAPAEEWVIDYFGDSDGLTLAFASGVHPCKFPQKLLGKHFNRIETLFAPGGLASHTRESFDLLLQWAVAKNFHLDAEKYQTATEEINAMLHMVHLGTHLKMVQFEALGESIAKTLTEILVKDRRALIGAHIRFAFKNFESSHPIQLVFVNAAVQDRIEFKNNGESQNEGMAKRGERAVDYPNAAHRAAFRGHEFKFAEEMAKIPNFELLLLRAFVDTWEGRWECKEKYNKSKATPGFRMEDPLSGNTFFLPSS